MSNIDAKKMSAFDIFNLTQETLDEAKKKSNEESGSRVQRLRLAKDGTISVRILPLAPMVDENGQPIAPIRKGYEYPVKELVLKIVDKDKQGKAKTTFVNVCNATLAFPKLKNDLIDLYVRLACETHADDEKLCKTIKESSFNGGLKYDSKRCMYVYNLKKREDGLQILQLSFSQYKDLEERKLELWKELREEDENVMCPICSPTGAYPVKIKGKTEKKKTTYSFDISTTKAAERLTEEELNELLDAPRLPEVLYVYKRFHLEATIEFLRQYDEKMGINIMDTDEIQDCIDQIKMSLHSDDQSHFTLGGGSTASDNNAATTSLDDLWEMWEKIDEAGDDDRSEEGQELRTAIREYIEEHELDIKMGRKKTNEDILKEIEALVDSDNEDEDDDEEDDEPKPSKKSAPKKSAPVEEDDDEDAEEDEPSDSDDDEEDDDDEDDDDEPSPRRTRNDDTNEPAARTSRRSARPERRRR